METVEELKGMTQEDLVRLVQELQEENEKMRIGMNGWINDNIKLKEKIETLTKIVKELSTMLP